jgi:hypothetical protein
LSSTTKTETTETPSKHHRRPTKALLEHNLNEVYRLMILGISNNDIMQQMQLPNRTFRRYVQILRDRNIASQLAKRQEYFLDDVKLAKDRLLFTRRQNLHIINNEATEPKDKIEALKLDAALTMTLLKLEYEGTTFLRVLNLDIGNRIETPRLIQRQRDIIRSEDIKPAITAAESTTIGKPDTTTEDQASMY